MSMCDAQQERQLLANTESLNTSSTHNRRHEQETMEENHERLVEVLALYFG